MLRSRDQVWGEGWGSEERESRRQWRRWDFSTGRWTAQHTTASERRCTGNEEIFL